MTISFEVWLERAAALLTARKVRGETCARDGRWTAALLQAERGDEPLDSWRTGYPVTSYVAELADEYAEGD